jgi:uncharacterized Zn finger protein
VSGESVEAKAHRYVRERRLVVTARIGDRIAATCRGSRGETYDLGYDRGRSDWFCTCPARGRCAHLVALQFVTVMTEATR